MTSLELFRPSEHEPAVPKEWGSGKFKEDVNVYVPGPPTWQYSGEPIKQHYGLTHLKLSNVRTNDQLLPKPQESQMGRIMINRDFPAEHPYSSHMPRTAVFPKFDASEDPKRGVFARAQQPINAEMPATAFDVQIIHKTKGAGLRHELQALPKESEKTALEWQGERGFHQLVKAHGGRQQYYPVPPKTVVPNLQARGPDMALSDHSANALRNIERDQWQTTYDLQHTGIGPSNPKTLDNLDYKRNVYGTFGVDDEALYPRSKNTFDPPRPFEGRTSRKLIPKPPHQKPGSSCGENTSYKRMMTLREKEEDRLWNGKEYVNLPESHKTKSVRWKELNDLAHPEPNLEKVEEAKEDQPAEDIPYYPTVGKPEATEEKYLMTTKDRQDDNVQEIEARNRFKVLEAQKPHHDLSSLSYKMERASASEKPKTFYNHEGQYNEERAGLYRTSYQPERLVHSMNPRESSAEIMDTFHSYRGVDDLNLPTRLNQEVNDALRYSRTLTTAQANLAGDRRDGRQVIRPLQDLKQAQKQKLLPTDLSSRVRVQEGEILNKESEMGETYNTHKFLQDYELPRFARNEPLNVMSTSNQKLSNVRGISSQRNGTGKSVSFSDSVTVASTSDNGPIRVFGQTSSGLTPEERKLIDSMGEANTTQYTSTQAMYNKQNSDTDINRKEPKFTIFSITAPPEETVVESKQKPVLTQRKPRRAATSMGDTEYRDEFGSLSSNVAPTNLRHSFSMKTAYESQFPTYNHIGYKDDMRFSWEPGCGAPRPQSTLLDIQNSFSKSSTRRKFHSRFSESNPDLRENIIKGKKHSFFGMNGQVLHG